MFLETKIRQLLPDLGAFVAAGPLLREARGRATSGRRGPAPQRYISCNTSPSKCFDSYPAPSRRVFAHFRAPLLLTPVFSRDPRSSVFQRSSVPVLIAPLLLSIPGRTESRIEDTFGISKCFEKHTVNVCMHQGSANIIRRSKEMLPFVPFHKIAFNFCEITMRPWPFAVPQA